VGRWVSTDDGRSPSDGVKKKRNHPAGVGVRRYHSAEGVSGVSSAMSVQGLSRSAAPRSGCAFCGRDDRASMGCAQKRVDEARPTDVARIGRRTCRSRTSRAVGLWPRALAQCFRGIDWDARRPACAAISAISPPPREARPTAQPGVGLRGGVPDGQMPRGCTEPGVQHPTSISLAVCAFRWLHQWRPAADHS